jgi:hypothetical protein
MERRGTTGKETRIVLRPREARAAFDGDLPLDRDLAEPIVVDASDLIDCHPMFALRLRLFLDWHRAAGNVVTALMPRDPDVAQHLADIGVGADLPESIISGLPEPAATSRALVPIRQLRTYLDVEDVSDRAMTMLHQQAIAFAVWGEPVHMAVSELCDNALQHGRNRLGAYVAADRVGEEIGTFRLAIADLGIGIPEHIRERYPEWQDDTSAIVRALQRGVTGTGDPHRGNGFSEVVEDVNRVLVRAQSSVNIEIRSAKGGVVLEMLDGRVEPRPATVELPRRGTWITYTVTTIRA